MERLAQAAVRDLDAAFSRIVLTHGATVYSTALRVRVQRADAEDLASETFARAYKALSGYSPERILALRLRPWLVTITLNLWRNQIRDASRAPALVPLDSLALPADPARGPEQIVLDRDWNQTLGTLLDRLPEGQRLSVLLRHVVGLPYSEIAQVLDCPTGTVKSQVSRGLATLRNQLRPDKEVAS